MDSLELVLLALLIVEQILPKLSFIKANSSLELIREVAEYLLRKAVEFIKSRRAR